MNQQENVNHVPVNQALPKAPPVSNPSAVPGIPPQKTVPAGSIPKDQPPEKIPVKIKNASPGPKINPDFPLVFFIFFFLINLALVAYTSRLLVPYLSLKDRFLSQNAYQKAGIESSKLADIKNLDLAFPSDKRVIEIISEINKAKENFTSFSFSFDTDEPKIAETRYLPFTINLLGSKQKIFSLLSALTSSRETVLITGFNLAQNENQNFEALIKANLYLADHPSNQ